MCSNEPSSSRAPSLGPVRVAWKRKHGHVTGTALDAFTAQTSEVEEDLGPGLTAHKRMAVVDPQKEAERLAQSGQLLAEAGLYKQAQAQFSASLRLQADCARVLNMLVQVLMELNEDFEAVQMAQRLVTVDSLSHDAHLTLARAHRNFGEPHLVSDQLEAVCSFSRAVHLSPWTEHCRTELMECVQIIEQRVVPADTPTNNNTTAPITNRSRLII